MKKQTAIRRNTQCMKGDRNIIKPVEMTINLKSTPKLSRSVKRKPTYL